MDRTVKNTTAVYRQGANLKGWCCDPCHKTFNHNDKPRPTFARFMFHKLTAHGVLLLKGPTDRTCTVTHVTGSANATTWTFVASNFDGPSIFPPAA